MSELLATPSMNNLEGLNFETIDTSIISVSSQHIMCEKCDYESESVSSLSFTITNREGVKEFTLPPASSIELKQLSILFGSAHAFVKKVAFATLPGFEISIEPHTNDTVRVSMIAETQMLAFMGLSNSQSRIHMAVAKSELPNIEHSIQSIKNHCK